MISNNWVDINKNWVNSDIKLRKLANFRNAATLEQVATNIKTATVAISAIIVLGTSLIPILALGLTVPTAAIILGTSLLVGIFATVLATSFIDDAVVERKELHDLNNEIKEIIGGKQDDDTKIKMIKNTISLSDIHWTKKEKASAYFIGKYLPSQL